MILEINKEEQKKKKPGKKNFVLQELFKKPQLLLQNQSAEVGLLLFKTTYAKKFYSFLQVLLHKTFVQQKKLKSPELKKFEVIEIATEVPYFCVLPKCPPHLKHSRKSISSRFQFLVLNFSKD